MFKKLSTILLIILAGAIAGYIFPVFAFDLPGDAESIIGDKSIGANDLTDGTVE